MIGEHLKLAFSLVLYDCTTNYGSVLGITRFQFKALFSESSSSNNFLVMVTSLLINMNLF